MKQSAALVLAFLFVLTSCTSSKNTTTSSLLQKRKYRKGWYVNIPQRSPENTAKAWKPTSHSEDQKPALTAQADLEQIGSDRSPKQAAPMSSSRSASLPIHSRLSESLPKAAAVPAGVDFRGSSIANRTGLSVIEQAAQPSVVNASMPEGSGRTNGWAIAGFVCSLLFPLLGLIFSAIALGQIKRTGERGHGLAMAGLIISIVFMLIVILAVL